MEKSSCPIAELLPSLLFHRTAQQLYDDPEHVADHIETLGIQAREHYTQTGLAKVNPGKAEFLTARAIWDALQAPLVHQIEVSIVDTMLDHLQRGASLVEETSLPGYNVQSTRYQPHIGNSNLTLVAHNWFTSHIDDIYHCINDFDNHYHPLWQALVEIHPLFCGLEFQNRDLPIQYVNGQVVSFRRPDDPTTIFDEPIDNIGLTVIPLIRTFVGEARRVGLDPQTAYATLLAHSEELSWCASIKRNAKLSSDISAKHGDFLDLEPATPLWKNRGLYAGPWRVPGFCPANPELRAPTIERQEKIEAFFAQKAADGGSNERHKSRPYGSAQAAELRIIWVSYLAREIALHHEPQSAFANLDATY